MSDFIVNTQNSYDQVASEYAEKFKDAMDDKPFDRACLDRLAREAGNLGPICDLESGPDQFAWYLHRQGLATVGAGGRNGSRNCLRLEIACLPPFACFFTGLIRPT